MKKVQVNPFVLNNPIKVIGVRTKKTFSNKSNIVEGVAYEGDTLSSSYYIEQQSKTSVYSHPYYSIDELIFGVLGSKGRDVYLYIITHMPDNKDYVTLKPAEIRKATGLSRNTIFAAFKELKEAGIIATKSQSVYWINPFYIFKGNRLNFYRDISEELIETVSYIDR